MYQEALRDRPDDAVRLRLAFALLRAGDGAAAQRTARDVLAREPDSPDGLLVLGLRSGTAGPSRRATPCGTSLPSRRRTRPPPRSGGCSGEPRNLPGAEVIWSRLGRRAGYPTAAAAARPAVRPENRQPPRKVPSRAL
jgi:hypothetical protein